MELINSNKHKLNSKKSWFFKSCQTNTQAVFGSCKSISGKYSIFRKCYFPERKIFSCVWLHFKKFSEKYFLVFGEEEGKDKPDKPRKKDGVIAPRSSRSRLHRSTIVAAVDRDLADRRAVRLRSRRSQCDRAVLLLGLSGLSFPSSSPNNRKFFSENFLKCNQTHENIFLFRKWNIFWKCFYTNKFWATKTQFQLTNFHL